MSQVLIVVVISFGSVLNLLAKPWSSTESLLERRRNDIIAIILWTILLIIAIFTVRLGIANSGGEDAFDLQDWTALVLPFALASPYLLELAATLVRQIEMWRWMRRAAVQALPIAWLYRTMTVGEQDPDGEWIRTRQWDPLYERYRQLATSYSSSSLWQCTSRDASLYHLFRKWMDVLLSALNYLRIRTVRNLYQRKIFKAFQTFVALLFVTVLAALTATLLATSTIEILLLLAFDYIWWLQCKTGKVILPRYDTVHFGRQEMQSIFEKSRELRDTLDISEGLDRNKVHNKIMGAMITTTAVLENSFRKAYLAVPVYDLAISNRKALRERYDIVGCKLDRLIKQVRLLLETRHTSGLLSVASSTGTIEASLHNNIESVLSVALFFKPAVLYNITSRVAKMEAQIEERIASHALSQEDITRERVVYIDARNAMFWLLWVIVTMEWNDPAGFWALSVTERFDEREREVAENEFPVERTEILYIIATFMSRCRYFARYRLDEEHGFYAEVRQLGFQHGKSAIEKQFTALSNAMYKHRSLNLLEWIAREYGLSWTETRQTDGPMECSWRDDAGAEQRAQCEVVLLDS